jgi:hypothetical protein
MVDETEEQLTPEQKDGRKFAADLKDLNARLTQETAALKADFGSAGAAEKEEFRSRILPILHEAKQLFARPGRRDGGVTFDQWLRTNKAKIRVGKSTCNRWLAEEGMQGDPKLPQLGETRIINGAVGKIVGLPTPDGDGDTRQMLVKFDGDTVGQEPDSVDLAPQKKHRLSPDTIYEKEDGSWCKYADGKLIVFLTAAQVAKAKAKPTKAKLKPKRNQADEQLSELAGAKDDARPKRKAAKREEILASAPPLVIDPIVETAPAVV